ncbi:MAG: hypothetical protein H0X16_06175 [Chloroflexi bacterium]|nr:hypothetical protein [Chloroflexota bacterium]
MSSDWSGRDPADEVPGALRDRAPDPLEPIDENAPVSGHNLPPGAPPDHAPDHLEPIDENAPVSGHNVPPPAPGVAETPEHDWATAQSQVFPLLRPMGTAGAPAAELREAADVGGTATHTQPIVDAGPAGLVVAYALSATGFDVLVNGEHLLSWGIGSRELHDAAMRNLAAWSAEAPWTDETSGPRRLLSSDTGEGRDAARILLPEVRDYLRSELVRAAPGGTRTLVGLPERHLLVAGALAAEDSEFGALFQEFVIEQSGGADDPLDQRIFELAGDELLAFEG